MRSKLQKFTEFTQSLLPHETAYLLAVQQFDDKNKVRILEIIDRNCREIYHPEPFDEQIDKRKYSSLKQWITERLSAIDVDAQYQWLLLAEQEIETDSLSPETESRLLAITGNSSTTDFYFTKAYELLLLYRHFLLIRMRYRDYEQVAAFLDKYRAEYERSHGIRDQLNRATYDIVRQYSGDATNSMQWETWLSEVFDDERLDGWNRYMALVRLTFIYFNYQRFEPLLEKYAQLDALFARGAYYSKRLLANYYGNLLLLHSKFKDYAKAEYFGYLSVRVKTSDYIHYVNNLCAVLLRQKKYQEAFRVMKEALPESRSTHSFHNRVGFVALYLRCQHHLGQYRSAENYADAYLRAYRKEIMVHRWHMFFSAYLEVLLAQRNYGKMVKLVEKNQLLEKDIAYREKSHYLPSIPWYYAVAAEKTSSLQTEKAWELATSALADINRSEDKMAQMMDLLKEIETHHPGMAMRLKDQIGRN